MDTIPRAEYNFFSVFSVQVPEIGVKSLKSDTQEMWPSPDKIMPVECNRQKYTFCIKKIIVEHLKNLKNSPVPI